MCRPVGHHGDAWPPAAEASCQSRSQGVHKAIDTTPGAVESSQDQGAARQGTHDSVNASEVGQPHWYDDRADKPLLLWANQQRGSLCGYLLHHRAWQRRSAGAHS